MIKARPKYTADLHGTIYIDNIEKAVVICLIIPTTFPVDAGWITYVIHPGIFYAGIDVEMFIQAYNSVTYVSIPLGTAVRFRLPQSITY